MVKLCARGSAILAELSRLSDHVPKVYPRVFNVNFNERLSILLILRDSNFRSLCLIFRT